MKQSFAENKSLAFLIGILGFVLLGAFYYYAIYPKSEDASNLELSIESIKQETQILETEVAVLSEVEKSHDDDFELRKKLPVNRHLDEILRSLNEVELISESKIVSIAFNNYDEEVAKATNLTPAEEEVNKPPVEEEGTTEETTEGTKEEETTEVEKPVTLIDITTLPPELKLITLNVDMITLDEDHLLLFLKELESLERVIRIDSVAIAQPGEEELALRDPDKRISVTVQLTTFYSE